MDYALPSLRADLAGQVKSALGLDVVVADANPKFDADLAIAVFGLAKTAGEATSDVAEKIKSAISHEAVARANVTSGYVNIWLKADWLAGQTLEPATNDSYGHNQAYINREIVIEHTDPNPFKELHIGHLYSNTVGESLSRLYEAGGARVHRVSYHGDIGLHIAKAIWGIIQELNGQPLDVVKATKRAEFLGRAYARGAKAYDKEADVRPQIEELNQKIYEQSDPDLQSIYKTAKDWSFEYFDSVYQRLGVGFEKHYLESDAAKRGAKIVRANIHAVFETSDGAVVFRGESHDLHTRVFINSQGLPTYEAKDLALPFMKAEDFNYDESIIITANEQNAYFAVMLKALEQIDPGLAGKTRHIGHGVVKLPSGKMGSRTGNVVTAVALLDEVERAIKTKSVEPKAATENALGAIKYAFLKQNIGADIVYDVQESINLEGQSGPYVQYAAVRIQSILNKAGQPSDFSGYDWSAEKSLLVSLAKYPEVVAQATKELEPHRIAQFIYQLSREMNRYYEEVPVKDAADNERSARIKLLKAVLNVTAQALKLLNIPLPAKM
ncbi:MAG TPA: arginine--tRNA ligase [Candidatus Saccharimonadales bacterium]